MTIIKVPRRLLARLSAVVLLSAVSLASSLAHAELLQYTFTDPYGSAKTLTPSAQYANAVGPMTFTLSGGVSRAVRVSILTADGKNVLGVASSPVLGASDLITVNGQAYYGAQISLPAPAEGTYQIKADVLSSGGDVISTSNYPLIEDVTPPKIGGWQGEGFGMCVSWSGHGSGTICPDIPDDALLGPAEGQLFGVYGVTDVSGLASGTFQTLSVDKSNVLTTSATTIVAGQGTVSIGTGVVGTIGNGTQFPATDGPLIARFTIVDKAGNKGVFDKPLRWNGVGLTPTSWALIGVSDPSVTTNPVPGSPFTGFAPYVAGMTVKQNPFKLLVRIEKAQWIGNNPYGIFIRDVPSPKTYDYADDNYVYKVVSIPYSSTGNAGNMGSLTDSTTNILKQIPYSLVLGAGVPSSPSFAPNAIQIQFADTGWVYTSYRLSNTPITWTAARFIVNPQPYDQVVVPWFGQCAVPAGQTECTVTGSWTLDPGAGKSGNIESSVNLKSADGTLKVSSVLGVRFIVDETVPVITGSSVSLPGRTALVTGNKADLGSFWGISTVAKGTLEAKSAAVDRTFTGTLTFSGATDFSFNTSFAGLPDGQYDLIAHATDTAGNVGSKDIGTYTIDTTAPTVNVIVPGGDAISTIDDVTVTLTDAGDASPKITSVNLSGGPSSTNVNLAYSQDGNGVYHLEYPVLAPSLGQGTPYALAVTASDASGNVAVKKVSFSYTPPQVALTDLKGKPVRLPAIGGTGDLHDTLQSGLIKLTDGTPVSGIYPVSATLTSDSPVPVLVGNVSLTPGQTVTLDPAYNFGTAGGRYSFPIAAASGTPTAGGVDTILLTTTAPNAPIGVASVTFWDPSKAIAVAPVGGKTAYTVDVAPYTVQATRASGSSDCAAGITVIDQSVVGTRGSLLPPAQILCGVVFDAYPSGAKVVTASLAGLTGYLHDEGNSTISYRPGVLYRATANGAVEFYPTPAQSLTLSGTSLDDAAPTTVFEPSADSKSAGGSVTNPVSFVGTNQFAGNVRATAPWPGLTMVMTPTVGKVQTIASQNATVAGQITTNDTTLWDTLHYGFDVYYTRRPDKVWHTNVDFTVVPQTVNITLARQPSALVSTTPVTLAGQLGVTKAGKFVFDPATMGDWRVQMFQQTIQRNGSGMITGTTLTPLPLNASTPSAPVAVNADGSFASDVGLLPAGGVTVVVKATLYRSGQPTSRSITTSGNLQLTVLDGDPIPAKLIALQGDSGIIAGTQAYTPVLNLQMDSRYIPDVAKVAWSVSTDGGATWSTAGETTSLGLRPSITKSGTYLYKAQITNKYSGLTSETNSVTVEGFERPTLSITGPTAGFVGRPVTLQAVSNVANTLFTWSVKTTYNDAHPQTFSGPTLVYTPQVAGTMYVTLSGEQAGGTIDNALRVKSIQQLYSVSALKIPKPIISGPNVVETGKPMTFKVVQQSPFNNNQTHTDTIVGQWVLPAGSTQTGFDPLTVSIDPGQKSVSFQSWIEGLQDSTMQTTVFNFTTWTYQFPTMAITASIVDPRAPANGVFTANYANQADARNTGGEKYTFVWSLPAGASLLSQNGSTITVQFTEPGDQQVKATVSDTRGNSREIESKVFTIAPSPTLQATIALTGSDQWSRTPSDVQVKVALTSVPKGDSLKSVDYALDGTPQTTSTNLSLPVVVHVVGAGDHTIAANVHTAGGASASVSKSFSLVTGDSPVCSITSEGLVTKSITLRSNCTVKMGKVTSLKWSIDGQETNLSSTFITFTATQLQTVSSVTLTATTDKGQTGSANWSK